jgi:hypothetical protein
MSNQDPFAAMGGLAGMLGGLQQRMEAMKERIARTEVEGIAAGGKVKVRMTCNFDVLAVSIDPSAMADRELLEDLVRAAMGDAAQKARDEMARGLRELAGGLPIPPGLIPGL